MYTLEIQRFGETLGKKYYSNQPSFSRVKLAVWQLTRNKTVADTVTRESYAELLKHGDMEIGNNWAYVSLKKI